MNDKKRYAIGQQDFKTLRLGNAYYVDKTSYIEKIVGENSQYYFLARPRRFGKSLFLSTLRYFFEGERDLFKGLHIDSSDWKWEKYPVLYLDLNSGEYTDPANLDAGIDNLLTGWENEYGIDNKTTDSTTRFFNIIKNAHEKTGRQVVVLVDEYDKPLVKNLDKDEEFETYRDKLASLYSNFKTCAPHIRFVFMTGVSRFSKLSVFSSLNNLKDITFTDDYADICGITEQELLDNFQQGIEALAKEYGIGIDDARSLLKKQYDGYRFARTGSEIYNPWSLLNCLRDRDLANYWNETGMPTLIAQSIKKVNIDLEEIFDTYCSEDELKGLDLLDPNPVALLYQTGYLTIKDYDRATRTFHLAIPNSEVKEGLIKVLLPYYSRLNSAYEASKIKNFINDLYVGRPDKFLTSMQTYFAGVSYMMKMDNENNFHNAFFLVTSLIGLKTDAEINTSDGRIDMTITTPKYIYIIELKYDKSASEALRQIDRKKYDRKYRDEKKKIFKIGVNFSSSSRNIEEWEIEECS